MGGREKVVFHGAANVRLAASERTGVTPKICSGSDVNPLCLLQKQSAEKRVSEFIFWRS